MRRCVDGDLYALGDIVLYKGSSRDRMYFTAVGSGWQRSMCIYEMHAFIASRAATKPPCPKSVFSPKARMIASVARGKSSCMSYLGSYVETEACDIAELARISFP